MRLKNRVSSLENDFLNSFFSWWQNSFIQICMHAKSFQSCPTLCDPLDCSPLGSSVHGILQARILEWVALPFSRGSSLPRDQIHVSCIAGRCSPVWATREAQLCVFNLIQLNSPDPSEHLLRILHWAGCTELWTSDQSVLNKPEVKSEVLGITTVSSGNPLVTPHYSARKTIWLYLVFLKVYQHSLEP